MILLIELLDGGSLGGEKIVDTDWMEQLWFISGGRQSLSITDGKIITTSSSGWRENDVTWSTIRHSSVIYNCIQIQTENNILVRSAKADDSSLLWIGVEWDGRWKLSSVNKN